MGGRRKKKDEGRQGKGRGRGKAVGSSFSDVNRAANNGRHNKHTIPCPKNLFSFGRTQRHPKARGRQDVTTGGDRERGRKKKVVKGMGA